ncbi:MAG TPA: hypothetical protein VFB63_19375 [Bryobacteraceae bacterium]|nr:hypothetical protein [Bryobacteraceae bacterium]
MKEVPGRINTKNAKPPNPKPSPKDFVWPSQDHDDKVAEKIAASLQELLPAREWKHTDLARALYGSFGANESPRNVGATRRWVVAEHPIPNEQTAGYIAEVLGVSMARLLEPEGKYDPTPPMIRPRSDSVRFPSGGKPKKPKKTKKAATTTSGKDRDKQRAYNAAYRAKKKAEKTGKRPYVRKAKMNGHAPAEGGAAWVLAEGVSPPDYHITSSEEHPGHVELKMTAMLPLERAMAILHMLKTGAATE